jgi:hypothetical protein
VDRKHIERIVDLQSVLHKADKDITDNAGHHAEDQGANGSDEARSRCDRGQSGNGACYETHEAGLAVFHPFDRHPGQ